MSTQARDTSGQFVSNQPLSQQDAMSVFEGLLSSEDEDKDSPQETPDAEASQPTGDEPEADAEQPAADEKADQSEEQEETEEQAEKPPSFRVKVAGEEVEVTLDELLKGYSRTEDYTRKTQAAAEQRKAAEAEAKAYRESRDSYAATLQQLDAALQAVTPQEPNWEEVQRTHPDEFPALWARWQQHKDRLAAVQAERQRVEQEQAEDGRQQITAHISNERERLMETIPTWRDKAVREKEQADIRDFAKSVGFTDAEIAAVSDHRAVLVMREAMLARRAQQKKPDVQKKLSLVKPAKPGSSAPPKGKQSAAQQRADVLRKTGRVQDAAALFHELLPE